MTREAQFERRNHPPLKKRTKLTGSYCVICGSVIYFPSLAAEAAKEKALVAQLDRASDYGSEGLRFKSSRAHLLSLCIPISWV
jgi:hypothetical protein